ncbi:ATP-grasp domain-containing protein [Butyrivibrio sp. FC2001]|uniref:ATP-grasp domain-containing protein n=1 Tax=Butyrivibrio sp. FC2001 TaxID=1280671 RepID=UPI00047DB970|nr:ATP-grasp domain-containing protein [Butyrivibrio sp. FC2001]
MQKNILIFPAGTEIAFEIQNSLKYSKFVKIYGGTSASDHSEFTYAHLIDGFPFVDDDGFLSYLNQVIDENSIDCVYPAHDSVCMFFSAHSDEIHAQVIIADEKTTGICRSKKKTYEYFQGEDFVPKSYGSADEVDSFPVFVKPAVGQGSAGASKINNKEELEIALSSGKELVICEYLPGVEYTVDCFTDGDGKLKFCRQRNRERIRIGISVRTRSMETDVEVKHIADTLNSRLNFKGAWFFQVKKTADGKYKLMEVSPRIPGTAGLYRNSGVNLPMLTLFTFWGYPVSIIENDYDIVLDRAFYSAFRIDFDYDTVYLDYDDTLTLGDKVNADVMRFIYQARNAGKRIILLSKHSTDLHVDLKKAGISEELFEEIIVLSREQEKSDCIKEKKAIFIDDSFAERKRIKDRCGIPVFDVDMIESLIDWKT